jgi:hypothetical protein
MTGTQFDTSPSRRADWSALASNARLWFWAGFAFVVAAFVFLELVDPFTFCQDDALVGELPAVLLHMRAAWKGIPAEYNPYVCLGSPTPALVGFYPPMYLAYAIARHLLGNEYATLDVFAALHLAAGYCFSFVLTRRLGIGPVLAALASLTFVLSGPVLVMARCWHSFAVLATFIPLFGLLVDLLRTGGVTWRWPLATGIALGLFYQSGFLQLFVLGCGIMLLHAFTLAAVGRMPWRRLGWLVPALAFGAAIAIPMFCQQWRVSKDLPTNEPSFGWGAVAGIPAMLLPYPLAVGPMPNDWGNENLAWAGHFYYFGTVLLVGCLAAGIAAIRQRLRPAAPQSAAATARPDASRMQLPLLVPALVAFLLALGEWGGLWWLLELLPVGLKNNPFRAMPWFVFYACVSGARFFEDFLAGRQSLPGRSAESRRLLDLAAIAGMGLALVALHLTRVGGLAFYTYGFRPYPPLLPAIANLVEPDKNGHQSRILSFAALQTGDPSYPLALPRNLPCLHEVPAFFGYDPVVERFDRYKSCVARLAEDPQAALAAYGVRWLLVHRTAWGGWKASPDQILEQRITFAHLFKPLSHNPEVSLPDLAEYLRVFEIPDPAPLAFDESEPAQPLALEMSTAGLVITLEPEPRPRRVVANFLRYPAITAMADGRPATVGEDAWQRIVVDVPAGARAIRIRHSPPRGPGIALALLLSLGGCASLLVCQKVLA